MSSRRFLFQLWKKAPTRPEIVILSSILSITTVFAAKLKQESANFCQPSFNPLLKPEVIRESIFFKVIVVFGALNKTFWNFMDCSGSGTFWTILKVKRSGQFWNLLKLSGTFQILLESAGSFWNLLSRTFLTNLISVFLQQF